MNVTIKNGDNGGIAHVIDNKLQVFSISEDLSIASAKSGENYNINTGAINLTSSTKSAVLYMKNNEEKNFIIEDIIVILSSSTGGTGDLGIEIIKNPSTGTIITNAIPAEIVENRNFGSNRELVKDICKGDEGDTLTNGSIFAETTRGTASTVVNFDGDIIILPKGSALGVNVTPQASNTSMDVRVAIIGYLF